MHRSVSHRGAVAGIAIALGFIGLGTSDAVGAGTRDEAISVVDVDKLAWKDYPGLPGVTFVVVAGDPNKDGITPSARSSRRTR